MRHVPYADMMLAMRKVNTMPILQELLCAHGHMKTEYSYWVRVRKEELEKKNASMSLTEIADVVDSIMDNGYRRWEDQELEDLFDTLTESYDFREKKLLDLEAQIDRLEGLLAEQADQIARHKAIIVDAVIYLLEC